LLLRHNVTIGHQLVFHLPRDSTGFGNATCVI
jgi:hypothetical protein